MDPATWRSVDQAVASIREGRPDVVLLDVHLRKLSARDVYLRLKGVAPDLARKVVFFTGGPIPHQGLDRPVVNKMLAWDDFVLCILRAVHSQG
jgi:CheY-like chemotaxis protein